MIPYNIVVAVDAQNGIGKDGILPWHIPGDLRYFKDLTTQTKVSTRRNAVVMGRKTWESLPRHVRPLPDRVNIVMTRNSDYPLPKGVLRVTSFQEIPQVLRLEKLTDAIEQIFIIGGAEIYQAALRELAEVTIYLTQILGIFDCDTFFPDVFSDFVEVERSEEISVNGVTYCFSKHLRKK
jgi:dihydrofolate reductase/thymidylate synthase